MAKTAAKRRTKKPDDSPSKSDVVAQILTGAQTAAADPKAFDAAGKYTDAATKSRRFAYDRRVANGGFIHYFRTPGEKLTGWLGASQRGEVIRGSVTWEYLFPLVTDEGELIYLPNNKRLRKAIEKAKCIFQRITITYEGKLMTAHGHHEKVYRVEAAPLGKGGVGSRGAEILAKAAKEAAGRKRSK